MKSCSFDCDTVVAVVNVDDKGMSADGELGNYAMCEDGVEDGDISSKDEENET